MDSSYPHPQAVGQSPFFYYNPDPKSNNRQHGNFSQQPSNVPVQMYQQQQHFQTLQSLPSTPIYSRPSSSCSQPQQQMYQQMYSHGYPMNMTPIVSPRPLYHKPTIMIQEHAAPRLMVESNMHESDMYYYPATPPLSASGSVISSPSSCDVLPTPLNPMFYGMSGFEGVKEGCETEVQMENLAGNEWARCGSPPMTPVFIHPNSLSSNLGASELLSATSCPSLSPSPSPYPPSAISEPQQQQQDFDFCDPRNLTVASCPSPSPLHAHSIKPASAFPALPTLCAEDDEHKYILGGETFTKVSESHSFDFTAPQHNHGLPEFDHFSDLDSESEFVNGLVNFPATENVQFFGNKRQRTCSDLTTISLDNSPFISEDDFEEFEEFDDAEQFAVACPPTPPASGSDTEVKEKKLKKERRTRKPKKARCEEDSSEFDNLVRSRKYTVPMNAAAGTPPQEATNQGQSETAPSQSGSSEANAQTMGTESEAGGATPSQAPVNRRGRKQSLTEDPTKTFVCEMCNRRFRRQEHLKRHYRSLHSQDKPFECHECGKKFSRSDNLSQHSRTHGSGAIIMGVLEDGEIAEGQENGDEHIHNLGSVLFKAAQAASGSETDNTDVTGGAGSDSQTRKKRKRSS